MHLIEIHLKGEVAGQKELSRAFGTQNKDEIIKTILKHGQLQVSDLERKAEYDR